MNYCTRKRCQGRLDPVGSGFIEGAERIVWKICEACGLLVEYVEKPSQDTTLFDDEATG